MEKRLAITAGAAAVVVGVVGYVVDVWRKVQIRTGGRYPMSFEDALSGAAGGVPLVIGWGVGLAVAVEVVRLVVLRRLHPYWWAGLVVVAVVPPVVSGWFRILGW